MKEIIKKILKEEINSKIINFTLDKLRSGKITPPYFKNLEDLGLSEEEIKITLEEFTGGEVNLMYTLIRDRKNEKKIYEEIDDENWVLREYNEFDQMTRIEKSNGYWENIKYDERGNKIYYEDSSGFWSKHEYDENDFPIYDENSFGEWVKKEYDKNGKEIYRETSDGGVILDKR